MDTKELTTALDGLKLELEGKTAIMRGKASVETTTVADLRHYAEDAGKSADEIEAITEPITSLTFEADGVLIMN